MANWCYYLSHDFGCWVLEHWNGTSWEYVGSYESENEVLEVLYSVDFCRIDDLGVDCDG